MKPLCVFVLDKNALLHFEEEHQSKYKNMTKHLENLTRGLYMEFKVNFRIKTTLTITGCVV